MFCKATSFVFDKGLAVACTGLTSSMLFVDGINQISRRMSYEFKLCAIINNLMNCRLYPTVLILTKKLQS